MKRWEKVLLISMAVFDGLLLQAIIIALSYYFGFQAGLKAMFRVLNP